MAPRQQHQACCGHPAPAREPWRLPGNNTRQLQQVAVCQPPAHIATYATLDLLLKHKELKMKHLQHKIKTDETFEICS
jgi:hypothetical protein